ncbi:MAG: EamA family transporter RarD [Pseudomonadota bacterium]
MTDPEPGSAGLGDGVLPGLFAYLVWGVLPVYFKLTEHVDVLEVLAHRIVWAVPLGALILLFRRQWPDVRRAFLNARSFFWLFLAAAFIGLNWCIYIYAVQQDQVFQASLGYYINPLMYVAIGVMFLGESLRRLQRVSIALAAVGVLVLTVSYGELPWIALALGLTFTAYGVIRKQIPVGAMPGLFIETLLLLPLAAAWLVWITANDASSFTTVSRGTDFLLLLSGPLTVIPLLCFAVAARKLTLTTIGFMQFIAPTLQFLIGVAYGELLTTAHLVCFAFIWTAVGLFSFDVVQANRRQAKSRAKPV